MAERVIVISRKQSESIDQLAQQKAVIEMELGRTLRTIVEGDGEVPDRIVWKTQAKDGIYTLVLELPDPPKPERKKR